MTHEGVEYAAYSSTAAMPLTHSGRFMDLLTSAHTVDFASSSWRTFQDYFRVLAEFAGLGLPQRAFLLRAQVRERGGGGIGCTPRGGELPQLPL